MGEGWYSHCHDILVPAGTVIMPNISSASSVATWQKHAMPLLLYPFGDCTNCFCHVVTEEAFRMAAESRLELKEDTDVKLTLRTSFNELQNTPETSGCETQVTKFLIVCCTLAVSIVNVRGLSDYLATQVLQLQAFGMFFNLSSTEVSECKLQACIIFVWQGVIETIRSVK